MDTNAYGIEHLWSQADLVIRTVAILLLAMSVASWTIIVQRALHLFSLRGSTRATQEFWHAHSIAEGIQILARDGRSNPFRHLAEVGQAAADHHDTHEDDLHGKLPMAEWLTSCMRGSIDESAESLQRGLSILASVGSTAPFVGLFGTVWGIYHALVSIGVSGQASIDKVAGPVGESLIMTAFGLAVAIPAVLGYNALTRHNKQVLGKLNRFAHQLHAYFLTGAPLKRNDDSPRLRALKPAKGDK
ncbi:MotA/TolQ/ExbB proton channel family protein [Ketobacter alkanivorans]|uniref:Biopolymer transport protein ExbB n=1 Tax=Ketobacter alkanivorans TaxID=1917421 RepID=A0A2K9LF45_9GAMM|nr:MotA/TolQ/ExbB proton channel family protein [Ketobacter alkanivorans]AUM10996.1 biopolymer transporter ExbB [Ketobacter alkanivorans]